MTRIGFALPCPLLACGETTAPIPTEAGYVLSVKIPGLTDTTFQAESLQLQLIWPQLETELPAAQSYQLSLNPPYDVTVQANSNLGTWGASKGGSPLPDATVRAVFWAPRLPDAHLPVTQPAHSESP